MQSNILAIQNNFVTMQANMDKILSRILHTQQTEGTDQTLAENTHTVKVGTIPVTPEQRPNLPASSSDQESVNITQHNPVPPTSGAQQVALVKITALPNIQQAVGKSMLHDQFGREQHLDGTFKYPPCYENTGQQLNPKVAPFWPHNDTGKIQHQQLPAVQTNT
jgi:hypothetical protein